MHREVDQYEDENVGVQALSEGEKAAGNVRDISKSRYARKLKKKAKMQGKKGAKTAKSSVQKPTAAQDAGTSGTGEGGAKQKYGRNIEAIKTPVSYTHLDVYKRQALLRQSATATPNPAALSAVGATFEKEVNTDED